MGKTVGVMAQGACRSLIIYRCELGDQGVYVCDAHDAQSSASLKVQGEGGQSGGSISALDVTIDTQWATPTWCNKSYDRGAKSYEER